MTISVTHTVGAVLQNLAHTKILSYNGARNTQTAERLTVSMILVWVKQPYTNGGMQHKNPGFGLGLSLPMVTVLVLFLYRAGYAIQTQSLLHLLDCPIVPLFLLGQSAVFAPQMQQLHVLLLNLGL